MAQIVTLDQFPKFNLIEVSELTADVLAAATEITVLNPDSFDDEHAILIGNPVEEDAEIVTPSALDGSDITVSALLRNHNKGTKVYKLRANKIKVYRATNTDDLQPDSISDYGSAIGTVTLQADQREIEFSDPTGGSGYWYLYTFYNDLSDPPTETVINLSEGVRGGDLGHYCTVPQIRNEAGFDDNQYIPDYLIDEARENSESQVDGALSVAGYTLPLTYVPPLIRNITKMLAAGYLLLTDYGTGADGSTKEGEKKIKIAEKYLDRIQESKLQLIGLSKLPVTLNSQIDGWPLDETADLLEDENGGDSMIKIKHEF